MPKCITLSSPFSVSKLHSQESIDVPWEYTSYEEEFQQASEKGGFFDFSHWGMIQIQGLHSYDFLHRMSTIDFSPPNTDRAHPGAFLTGKGCVVSLGTFLILEPDQVLYIISPAQVQKSLTHLEAFHFSEELTLKDKTSDWMVMGSFGNQSLSTFGMTGSLEPNQRHTVTLTEDLKVELWKDDTLSDFHWIFLPRKSAKAFLSRVEQSGFQFLGHRLFEYLRVQAGVPRVSQEVEPNHLILEVGEERSLSREKGCYPGQEVVERIFTYGQVNRKLRRVAIQSDIDTTLPVDLLAEGKIAGQLVTAVQSPSTHAPHLGLAFIKKEFFDYAKPLEGSNGLKVELR